MLQKPCRPCKRIQICKNTQIDFNTQNRQASWESGIGNVHMQFEIEITKETEVMPRKPCRVRQQADRQTDNRKYKDYVYRKMLVQEYLKK